MDEQRRFQQICDLFEKARTMPAPEREAYLVNACGDDEAMLREIAELLASHEEHQGGLDEAITPPTNLIRSLATDQPVPNRIGRYTIVRPIGQGGMGVVYLAKQDNPDREVAIKVMRSGLVSREMEKRFELETAVLGKLQHPGIAQIYEAGLHEFSGQTQPYFAMEFVDGVRLDEFLKRESPSVRQRLSLFTQICDAVNHAHQKGIIHRDLKPGNVLVAARGDFSDSSNLRETEPRIKILDFGVARSTDADLQVTSLHTDLGQLVGTIPYMSPEQIGGDPTLVDTRSDVYALGVLLYELLSGRLPYELTERTIVKAARVIVEQDPAPLSSMNQSFRGDLNTIALKALEKEPHRRYGSASDLASDIQRYLNNEPIVARPASAWYQFSKFASRNRGLVAGVVAALVALFVGTIMTAIFAVGQTQALGESEKQRRKSNAILNFLKNDLLGQANPKASGKNEMTVREALDRAADLIEVRFKNKPELEAEIRLAIGIAYRGLGKNDQSYEHQSQALQYFESVLPIDSERLYGIRSGLVTDYIEQWKLQEAEKLSTESIALAKQHLGEQHLHTGRLLRIDAALQRRLNRFDKAAERYQEANAVFQKLGDEGKRELLVSQNNLAITLRHLSRTEEAIQLIRNVIQQSREINKDKPLQISTSLYTLADLLWSQAVAPECDLENRESLLAESERLFREALQIRLDTLGDAHKDTVHCYYGLGLVADARKEHEIAESWQRKTLLAAEKVYGTRKNVYVLNAMTALSTTLRRIGQFEEATQLGEEAVRISSSAFGAQHYSAVHYRYSLYAAYWMQGDVEAIRKMASTYGETPLDRARGLYAEGMAHVKNDDVPSAVACLVRALEELPKDDRERSQWIRKLETLRTTMANDEEPIEAADK